MAIWHRITVYCLTLAVTLVIVGCAKRVTVRGVPRHFEEGYASWYGREFQGRRTASGERFNQRDLTAAHKTLPFNTMVEVLNTENDKSVVVRVNDRGPFVRGRVIDVSREAARLIDFLRSGTAKVKLFILPEGYDFDTMSASIKRSIEYSFNKIKTAIPFILDFG